MTYVWTDLEFVNAMKEQEPGNRARFLSMMYARDRQSFERKTPDEMLVNELGVAAYLELLQNTVDVVPIVAIPSVCLTA